MRKIKLSPLLRFLVAIIMALIVLIVSLLAFLTLNKKQPISDENTAPVESTAQIEQLQFVDGQLMQGEHYTFNASLQAPMAMQLPLKTASDFAPLPQATFSAVLVTNKGELTLHFFPKSAPVTVASFLHLAKNGFYQGLKFHRVEPDFVVQIGDPASREATSVSALETLGSGYHDYRLADEIDPALSHRQAGLVSMANINYNGQYPHTNGSQFFITLAPALYLDGRHTIFAQVTQGEEILPLLEVGDEIVEIKIQ